MPHYVSQLPPADLADWVSCFWQIDPAGVAAEPSASLVIPDGCMELVVELGTPSARLDESGVTVSDARGVVAGQLDRVLLLQSAGNFGVFGIRLLPWAGAAFGAFAPTELLNQTPALDEVFGPRGSRLEAAIAEAPQFSQRVVLAVRFLRATLQAPRPVAWLPWAVQAIADAPTQTRVAALARTMLVSPRQLERQFKAHVGLTPKQFAALLRFRRASELISASRSLTDVSMLAGYADQAHFVRDCRRIAGMSPKVLRQQLDPLSLMLSGYGD